MALKRERVKVEQLELELIKEGKAQGSLMASGRKSKTPGVYTGFHIGESLIFCLSLIKTTQMHCLSMWQR